VTGTGTSREDTDPQLLLEIGQDQTDSAIGTGMSKEEEQDQQPLLGTDQGLTEESRNNTRLATGTGT